MLKIKADSTVKDRLVVQGFSQTLDISLNRSREKGTIIINQKGYTLDSIQRYGMEVQPRVQLLSRAGTVPEPTGEETVERGGEAALPGDYWSRACILHKSPTMISSTRSTT